MIPDKTFNTVSQISHTLAGALAMVGGVFLFGPSAVPSVLIGFTAYAALKEFWYDERYESEEVRGSSLEDFLFYELGLLLGLGVLWGKSYWAG